MFDGISTREIIIFGIIICLVLFAIYLFTETRSLRATLDAIDNDDDDEDDEPIQEEGNKEEIHHMMNGPGNP